MKLEYRMRGKFLTDDLYNVTKRHHYPELNRDNGLIWRLSIIAIDNISGNKLHW
jgi:hypothetical protein